jgi:cytochrome c biogenesis protein
LLSKQEVVLETHKGFIEVLADNVWKFFSSVKLAVVLLIILAIVSIIGTVIQQNESPDKYLLEYSQSTVQLFEMLGFFDMYHTWWFVLLLLLLTANLMVCSLERFPHTWKAVTTPPMPRDDAGLKDLPYRKEISVRSGLDKAKMRAVGALKARRYSVTEHQGTGAMQFSAQKGVYSRLGVYITHSSIILVFLGALLGALFGYKAFLSLPEGETSNVVYLRNEPLWDKLLSSLRISKSRIQWNPQAGMLMMPLDFFVQCDNFDVDYYMTPGGMPTGMPSEYRSILSIFDLHGQKILDKQIRVNDPLAYRGITFYQSSYGVIPNAPGYAVLTISQKNAGGIGDTVMISPGTGQHVASIDRIIKVTGFSPFGLRNSSSGQIMLYHTDNDEYINPAVRLEVYKGKKLLYTTEILKTDRDRPPLPENYVIRLVHYGGTRFTGLQVTKDPGVWVVYTGFMLLCIGPLLSFFGSHKKIWVNIHDRKGLAMVTVAGSANKNRLGFEHEFTRIVDEIGK